MTEQYVYGIHAVNALLDAEKRKVEALYVNSERKDARIKALLDKAFSRNISVHFLPASAMAEQFSEVKHQGVVALSAALPVYGEKDLPALIEKSREAAFILILDGVTDPHNLGACLRSADAAGVDFVIVPKDKSAQLSPIVSRVACGAAESLPLVSVTNLARAIDILKEHQIWIYGAAGEAEQLIYELDFRGAIALVMGAEGKGLRRLTRERCDGLFSLPMLGTVDSLNVSVASGIALYEVLRQRQRGFS